MLISFALATFPRLIAIRAEILAQAIRPWSCIIDSHFWWLKLSEEKLFIANQRELTQTRKEEGEQKLHPPLLPAAWPGTVTSHLTLQMGCPESPKQPIYGLSLSARRKEGENWAVVNLMFLSNQVILCSRSLKGNSCFSAPPLSCGRGHLFLCLLQLLGCGDLRQWSRRKLQLFSISPNVVGEGEEEQKGSLVNGL